MSPFPDLGRIGQAMFRANGQIRALGNHSRSTNARRGGISMGETERRATRTQILARNRGRYLAERIGRALLDARTGSGRRQRDIAERAGISQSFYSRIERGGGAGTSHLTPTACALACDAQLAAFIEALPGSNLPHDIEHVRRQEAVVAIALAGGWRAMPERPIDPDFAGPVQSTSCSSGRSSVRSLSSRSSTSSLTPERPSAVMRTRCWPSGASSAMNGASPASWSFGERIGTECSSGRSRR